MLKTISSRLLMGILLIPTDNLDLWKIEAYSKIPVHAVSASEKGLFISVRSSAGPLLYPLKDRTFVSGFKVSGIFHGLPKFQEIGAQGKKGADDFALRIGFIVPGEKRLGGLKKIFAPDWVKRIYKQLPDGIGLSHIEFYDVVQNKNLVGTHREHPSSDLIIENFFAMVENPGAFDFNFLIKKPIEAIALWISVDGDDTKSNYDILISHLDLKTKESEGKK